MTTVTLSLTIQIQDGRQIVLAQTGGPSNPQPAGAERALQLGFVQEGRIRSAATSVRGVTLSACNGGAALKFRLSRCRTTATSADARLRLRTGWSAFRIGRARPLDCYERLSRRSTPPEEGSLRSRLGATRERRWRGDNLDRSMPSSVGRSTTGCGADWRDLHPSHSSFLHLPFLVLFGTTKKKAPSVAAKCLFFLPNLVGAIGLEPTTPTMSRWCSNQLSND